MLALTETLLCHILSAIIMEEKMFTKPEDPIDKDSVKISLLNLCVARTDVAQPSQDARSAVAPQVACHEQAERRPLTWGPHVRS
jgi:hypothetical protein